MVKFAAMSVVERVATVSRQLSSSRLVLLLAQHDPRNGFNGYQLLPRRYVSEGFRRDESYDLESVSEMLRSYRAASDDLSESGLSGGEMELPGDVLKDDDVEKPRVREEGACK
jgi:hypothetical protein